MYKAKVVIGSGYGDEGKGLVTDYLSQGWADLVVRFHGGAQAAHTVKHEDKEHVFGHVSSASFSSSSLGLGLIPTYLGPRFVVNPVLFQQELEELKSKMPYVPQVFVHPDCYVTTVFDMFINRVLEESRGANRYGSVGVGFNETITRNYDKGVMLQVCDLHSPKLLRKILNIKTAYVLTRLEELGFSITDIKLLREKYDFDKMQKSTMEAIKYFRAHTNVFNENVFDYYENVVFEGAQGLLLDEFRGIFPHVTRSSTGIENAWKMISKHGSGVHVQSYYVTRAYTTRHGAGPLNAEEAMPFWVQDTTNVSNEFQGSLRYAPLDVSLLMETIHKDAELLCRLDIPGMNHLVVTCMDQIPEEHKYIVDGKMITGTHEQFLKVLYDCIGYPMLLNHSAITPKQMAEF